MSAYYVAVIPKSRIISEDNKGWGGGLFGFGCCTRTYRQIVRPLEGHDTQLPLTHFLAKGGMYGVETCLLRWRLAIVLALTRIYRNRVGSCCSLLSTTLDAPPQARPAGKVERGGGGCCTTYRVLFFVFDIYVIVADFRSLSPLVNSG